MMPILAEEVIVETNPAQADLDRIQRQADRIAAQASQGSGSTDSPFARGMMQWVDDRIRQMPEDQAVIFFMELKRAVGINITEEKARSVVRKIQNPNAFSIGKVFSGWSMPAYESYQGFFEFFSVLLLAAVGQRLYFWYKRVFMDGIQLGRPSFFHPCTILFINAFNFYAPMLVSGYSPWLTFFLPVAAIQLFVAGNEVLKSLIKAGALFLLSIKGANYPIAMLVGSLIYLWVYHRSIFQRPALVFTMGNHPEPELSPEEHYEVLRDFCDKLRPNQKKA